MGSRAAYQKMAEQRDWNHAIDTRLRDFIRQRDSFYMASSNADGQPYVQHRGGPKGFLKVIDEHTLAFADFGGNQQYISVGNFDDNNKVHLFLMDYPNRARIKVWGEAEVVTADDVLLSQVQDEGYRGKVERIIKIKVTAWDINCPQHITPRYTLEEIEPHVDEFKARIRELEAKLADYESRD